MIGRNGDLVTNVREKFMDVLQAADSDSSFSAKELAEIAGVPFGTINGWLSDRRAFPLKETGARKARVYGVDTVKRLAVYLAATSQSLGWNTNDVKLLITTVKIDELWSSYMEGSSAFASFCVSKRGGLEN